MMFASCTKNESDLAAVQKTADPTEERILNFKHKMIQNLKSSESLSLDSAVWYLEAALNYSYCEIDSAEIVNIDSIFIKVPVSADGTINFSNVVEAYNQLNSGLINIFDQTPGEDINMQFTDISVKETNDKSNEITLKLTTVLTEKDGITNYTNFGDTDYWYPCCEQGKCGQYWGEQLGKDATTQLEYKANLERAYPHNGYITDIDYDYYFGLDFPDYFWQGYSNDCLSPDDMNHWLTQLKDFAHQHKPAGRVIVNYNVQFDFPPGNKSQWGFHDLFLYTGISHYGDLPY